MERNCNPIGVSLLPCGSMLQFLAAAATHEGGKYGGCPLLLAAPFWCESDESRRVEGQFGFSTSVFNLVHTHLRLCLKTCPKARNHFRNGSNISCEKRQKRQPRLHMGWLP
eukprot:1930413-Prymnesium_polylepis.1